tara:strand:+ start:119 stop:1042 length:924 start_codon:yes stop_codon:yes gene_type:complete
MKKLFLGILLFSVFYSCEDPIEIVAEFGETQLSVDAFLNNKNEPQVIYLKETKQFFDTLSPQQPYKKSTSVYVLDEEYGSKYVFESPLNDGVYTWDDSIMIFEGRDYKLVIETDDITYTSKSYANPVPNIDSLNWQYVPAGLGQKNGSYAIELVATDLPGQFDYYWIRFLKNGVYDTRLAGLNISVDGTFSETGQGDGQPFIPPISTLTSYDVEDSVALGDEVAYEIWSISPQTTLFWREVTNQAIQGGGIGALFATPTANVRTNIISPADSKIEDRAVGWFSTSLVSRASQVLYEKEGEKLSFDID